MNRIAVKILKSFRHIYGNKDVHLKAGGVYYLDVEKPEDRDELIYMMSGSFPYRFFISIEMSPQLMQILAVSKFDVYDRPPASPQVGRVYFNPITGKAYIWDGTTWKDMTCCGSGGGGGGGGGTTVVPALFGDVTSSGYSNEVQITPGVIVDADISPTAAIKLSKLEKNPLDRANHTGSQLANTISDFIPTVKTVALNQMAKPIGNLDMNNFRIINLQDPLNPQDAVTKKYVDQAIQNLNLTFPIPLSQGGTGIAANTGIEALNALEGVGDGRNLPITGNAPANSGRIFANKTRNTGATPSYLNFRRIAVTAPLTLVENTDHILISLGGTGTININTGLTGYPLTVANGGTGATTAQGARVNLGAVGAGLNSIQPATTDVGNVFRDVINNAGDITMRFRSLKEVANGGIDINTVGTEVEFSVREGDLNIGNMGGQINLAGAQVTGILPIIRGGTGANTIAGARDNLNVVYDARMIAGATGQSVLANPAVVQQAGDGGVIQTKGIRAGANVTITSTGTDIEISAATGASSLGANVGTTGANTGQVYVNNTGSTLNFRSIVAGPGQNVVMTGSDITISPNIRSASTAGAQVLAPVPTVNGNPYQIKSLVQGNGITLTDTNASITIEANLQGVANVGTRPGQVYRDVTNNTINLRTIGGLNNDPVQDGITVTTTGDHVLLQSRVLGAINIGTGKEVYNDAVTLPGSLEFRTLVEDYAITLTETAQEISVKFNHTHVGGETEVLKAVGATPGPAEFKTFRAGTGIILDNTTDPDVIEIRSAAAALTPDYAIDITNNVIKVEAENLAGTGEIVLSNPAGAAADPMRFRRVLAGTNISLANSTTNEIVIDVDGVITDGANVSSIMLTGSYGNGEVFKDKTGTTLNFKTLYFGSPTVGYPGAAVNNSTDDVVVDLYIVNATSLSTDEDIYTTGNITTAGSTLEFRGIKEGGAISLANSTTTDVQIDVVAENLGTGEDLIINPTPAVGEKLQVKRLQEGPGIDLDSTTTANTIIISAAAPVDDYGIEITTNATTGVSTIKAHAVNLGTAGEIVLANPTGAAADPMEFKRISPDGTNAGITVTSNATNVLLKANVGGAINVGTGLDVLKGLNATTNNLEFKRLADGYGIILDDTTVADSILIKAHAANLSGSGQPVLAITPTGNTDPLNFKHISPAATSPGINITADANNVYIQGRINNVTQVGTGESLLTNTLPLTAWGEELEFKRVLGDYGIDVSTATGDIVVKAEATNIGTTTGTAGKAAEDILNNPTGGAADPMEFKRIVGMANSGIDISTVGDTIVVDYTAGANSYSTPTPLAPATGTTGAHVWTVTHNLGLTGAFDNIVFNAYDMNNNRAVIPFTRIIPVDANTTQFEWVTGSNPSPTTSVHFRIVKTEQ